jgi:hypothetical protein
MISRWRELSKGERFKLVSNGSVNGCGASKGFDFDPLISAVSKSLHLQDKFAEQVKERVCYPHDYSYLKQTGKIKADIRLGINLYTLIRENGFSRSKSLIIAVTATLSLLLFG